jgi:hypothetical protein
MKIGRLFHVKRARKYPVIYDEKGLSLRERSFDLFWLGKRPVEVAVKLNAKESTIFRYFRDWKKLDPNFDLQYAYVKSLFNKNSPDRDKNLDLFSKACGISKEQLESILSAPHGLRRFLTGKLYFPVQADADHKRSVALKIAVLFSDHLVKNKGYYEDIYYALDRYMKRNMKFREAEDEDIIEQNKVMKLIHGVLAADLKNEWRDRVKPDTFSQEEREALMRYGIESEIKSLEAEYWIRIGKLTAEGLTPKQAREKMYQDLLKKGDLKIAKAMREFQDKVDPVKIDVTLGPPSPPPKP